MKAEQPENISCGGTQPGRTTRTPLAGVKEISDMDSSRCGGMEISDGNL
jgi:hypothetical protein